MTDTPVQVFVAAFEDEGQAAAALKDFRAMDREGSIDLIDAVVVRRSADGKVSFEETADPSGSPDQPRCSRRSMVFASDIGSRIKATCVA